jgi:hypothetical protein
MQDGKPYVEAAVALTAQGPKVAVYHGQLDPARLRTAIRRTADGLHYEVAVPWSALAPGFAPGGTVQPCFNLAVSDNDGAARAPGPLNGYCQALQLTPGLVDTKNPDCYGHLVFLP